MMKRWSLFFICFTLIHFSCTKTTHNVHFHGRITLDCNHQLSVKNCLVTISREYDTGIHHNQTIGSAVTDNNGYYSLITDVKQSGSFMDYNYSVQSIDNNKGNPASNFPMYTGFILSHDNNKDMEVNGYVERSKAYKFHIKNTSPVNNGDIFNSLIVSHLNALGEILFDLTTISNLSGTAVDTTIYQFYLNQPKISYNYSYTKNGVLTSVPSDTLAIPNCVDTMLVNIFY